MPGLSEAVQEVHRVALEVTERTGLSLARSSMIVTPSYPDGWLARGAKGSNLKYVLQLGISSPERPVSSSCGQALNWVAEPAPQPHSSDGRARRIKAGVSQTLHKRCLHEAQDAPRGLASLVSDYAEHQGGGHRHDQDESRNRHRQSCRCRNEHPCERHRDHPHEAGSIPNICHWSAGVSRIGAARPVLRHSRSVSLRSSSARDRRGCADRRR